MLPSAGNHYLLRTTHAWMHLFMRCCFAGELTSKNKKSQNAVRKAYASYGSPLGGIAFSAPTPCIQKNTDEEPKAIKNLILSSAAAEDQRRNKKMYEMGGFWNEMCCGCVGQEQGAEKILKVLWGAGFAPQGSEGGWMSGLCLRCLDWEGEWRSLGL